MVLASGALPRHEKAAPRSEKPTRGTGGCQRTLVIALRAGNRPPRPSREGRVRNGVDEKIEASHSLP